MWTGKREGIERTGPRMCVTGADSVPYGAEKPPEFRDVSHRDIGWCDLSQGPFLIV